MFQSYQKNIVRELSGTVSATTKEKILNMTSILSKKL